MFVKCLEDCDCPTHKMEKGRTYEVTEHIGNWLLKQTPCCVEELEVRPPVKETATVSAPETMDAGKPTRRSRKSSSE